MLENETKMGSEDLKEGTSVDAEDEETKTLGLKYKYAEGQWSPLNPEGKKHYNREFLLQFQHDNIAIQKPSALPDIPEIRLDNGLPDNDKPQEKDGEMARGIAGGQEFIDFTPKYVWGRADKKQNLKASPGSSDGRFSGWSRNSGNTGEAVEEEEKPNTRVNSFSALSRPDEDQGQGHRFGGISSACGEGRVCGLGGPPSLSTERFQECKLERTIDEATKVIGVSQSTECGHTKGSSERAIPESQPAPTEFTVLSETDMEKRTKAIIDKYFADPNMKVVILCVQELSTQNHHHFVYNAINHVLMRSSQARKQTGHILHDLVKQSVISLNNYLRGLVEVLEFAEDLKIRIPKIRQYCGELISPMAQDNSIYSLIKQAAAKLILHNKNGVLAVKLFYASQKEVLYKKTRSILNKLTPQKFQTLVSQMQALPIDSEKKLKGVINLIFEKAISEPSYCVAYANMCRCLSMFKVQSDSKPGEMVNFRAVLLTKCQREFEKDNSSEALFVTKREEIEKAEDDAQKEKLKKELKYEESKAKQRSLGNIRFIGELFKLKILTENIMHDCVFKLLRTKDPDNLECLCQLLTTIGKELDVDKAKPRMDQYFQQMGKIVSEKKIPIKVRFILQDVMDLRTNKWIPRRVDNNPKTIDQIHKEVAQEAQEKALLSQQNQMQQRAQRDGRRGGLLGQIGDTDSWNTVCVNRTPLKSVDRSIDPTTKKLTKLGSCENAGRFSGLGRGNTWGTTSRPPQEKEQPSTLANRAIGVNQSANGGHRVGNYGRSEPEPQPSQVQPAFTELKVLSEKDMERKTKAILDEYFAIQDKMKVILHVQEISTQNHYHFVYNAINHVLKRSSQARTQTGHILHDLVKQSIISLGNYIKGFVEVLEFAENLEKDIPKIWQYYGEMISHMIQADSVSLSFLKQVAAPLIANNKAGVLLAEILQDASHRVGHKKVAGLWTSSGLHWSDFVPKTQVEQFLRDKGLEYTDEGNSAPTTPTTGLSLKIDVKLHELIVEDKADNEVVLDWIENNVDDSTTRSAEFIRALMSAVCLTAITGMKGKERLEPKEISARNDLLQKYVDHQADSELQALYAVQALIAKLEHPQGVLRGMFDTLYDEDIISEDAFFQWEKSEKEPEGKRVCLKQSIQFFTWLREAEEDS